MAQQQLIEIREKIDEIDHEILRLLIQRANFALAAAKIKKSNNLDSKIYDNTREQQVINNVIANSHAPLTDPMIKAIFSSIISACRQLQLQHYQIRGKKIILSVMGVEGSYSEIAAKTFLAQYSQGDEQFYYDINSENVIARVLAKEADYGVVGISNSTAGLVQETLQALQDKACKIIDVVTLPIHHQLLALPNQKKIEHIYSHQQALAQCYDYLQQHYSQAKLHIYADTALAARDLAANKLLAHSAVIANRACSELYGLQVVAQQIVDKADNATTFLIIANIEMVTQSIGAIESEK